MHPTVSVSEHGDLNFIKEAIGKLDNAKVYVGIPEAETARDDEEITNAALMFIHTNGSEVMGIPKRAVIEPAIEYPSNKERIVSTLGQAADAMLDGNKQQAEHFIQVAGQQGSNASKRWFTDPANNWPPNKPSTIERKGSDRPLIDTGELRRAITFVTEF
jgi:hypothetical protein